MQLSEGRVVFRLFIVVSLILELRKNGSCGLCHEQCRNASNFIMKPGSTAVRGTDLPLAGEYVLPFLMGYVFDDGTL